MGESYSLNKVIKSLRSDNDSLQSDLKVLRKNVKTLTVEANSAANEKMDNRKLDSKLLLKRNNHQTTIDAE